MTIARIKSPDWGVGEILTAAQMNALDANVTNALDKRSGQTDTLESVITTSGAGRIVPTYATGADADTAYLVSGANALIDVPTLTADRAYTFNNTNAQAGDRIFILNRSSYYLTIKDAAATTLIVLGSEIYNNGESGWCELIHTGAVWVLARSALRPALTAQTFTSNGTWTCPRGVTLALVTGWGGGGAGGGGAPGSSTGVPTTIGSGGGGGGGAQRLSFVVSVTPGDAYAVTIGAGGTSVGAGLDGTDGGDTQLGSVAIFYGAQGGAKGVTSSDDYGIRGGCSTRQVTSHSRSSAVAYTTTEVSHIAHRQFGGGGFSTTGNGATAVAASAGVGSNFGLPGGAGGASGSIPAWYGGIGGGGGGGGGGGAGAAGGAGGSGGAAETGNGGAAGSSAGANSGAGGGGGGGGGGGSVTPGAGGASGAGGSGQLIVIPLR